MIFSGGYYGTGYDRRHDLVEYDVQNKIFIDHGADYYPSIDIWGYGPYYTQMGHMVYMQIYSYIYTFDLRGNVSATKLDTETPHESGYKACTAGSETPTPRLYVTGGDPYINAAHTQYLQVLDLNDMEWLTNLPNTQGYHHHHGCTVLNDKLWAIGPDADTGNIETINISNIVSNTTETWQYFGGSLTCNLLTFRVITVGDLIFIFGGDWYGHGAIDKVHVIHSITGNVTLYEHNLPYNVTGMPVILIDDTIYGFGGANTSWLTLNMLSDCIYSCDFVLCEINDI